MLNLRTLILVGCGAVLLQSCGTSKTAKQGEDPLQRGDAAIRVGKLPEAEKIFSEALADLGDAPSQQRARFLAKLGECAQRSGHPDQAVNYFQQAIEVSKAAAGGDSADQIGMLDAMRAVLYKQKQYTACEEAARKGLELSDKFLKPDDPRIEYGISNVLAVACLNGVCKDETGLLDRLIQIRTQKFGKSAQVTCAARQMAAEAMIHRKKYVEAANLYKENLEAYKTTAPKMVPAVSVMYARALNHAGKPQEALAALEAGGAGGADMPLDPEAVKTFALIGDIYDSLGKNAQAAEAYAKMAAAAEEVMGMKETLTADYLVRYAEFLKKTGKKKQAADLDRKIASIYKNAKQ